MAEHKTTNWVAFGLSPSWCRGLSLLKSLMASEQLIYIIQTNCLAYDLVFITIKFDLCNDTVYLNSL